MDILPEDLDAVLQQPLNARVLKNMNRLKKRLLSETPHPQELQAALLLCCSPASGGRLFRATSCRVRLTHRLCLRRHKSLLCTASFGAP